MSIKLMDQVWDLYLPDSQKIVMLKLADNASDEGKCYPAIATICAKTNKSESTVMRVIDQLEKLGHLTIERRPGRSSVYFIHPRRDMNLDLDNPLHGERGVTMKPPSGSSPRQREASGTVTDTPVMVTGGGVTMTPHRTVTQSSLNPQKGGVVDKSTTEEEKRKAEEWMRLEREAREVGFRAPDRLLETTRTFATSLKNFKQQKAGKRTSAGRAIADQVKAAVSGTAS